MNFQKAKDVLFTAVKPAIVTLKRWVLRPILVVVAVFVTTIAVGIYAGSIVANDVWNSEFFND